MFLVKFAREARDFFWVLPLENSVFSQFPLLKTAPQAKKKPAFNFLEISKKIKTPHKDSEFELVKN